MIKTFARTIGIALFQVGQRVKLLRTVQGIPAGIGGTIVHHFIASALYDVRFDGHPQLRAVAGNDLVSGDS